MARRSLEERLARLEGRGNELAGLPAAPAPSPVHVQTIEVLTELFSMADRLSTVDTPSWLRAMMATMKRSQVWMVAELATVPPDRIREFMAALIGKMQTIVDTPDAPPAQEEATHGAVTADEQPPGDAGRHITASA